MSKIPVLFTLPRVVQVQARVTELCATCAPPPGEEELEILRCTLEESEFAETALLRRLAEVLRRFPSLCGKELSLRVLQIGGNYTQNLTLHYLRAGKPTTFEYRISFGCEIFEDCVTVGFIHLWCLTADWPQQWPLHHHQDYYLTVPVQQAHAPALSGPVRDTRPH